MLRHRAFKRGHIESVVCGTILACRAQWRTPKYCGLACLLVVHDAEVCQHPNEMSFPKQFILPCYVCLHLASLDSNSSPHPQRINGLVNRAAVEFCNEITAAAAISSFVPDGQQTGVTSQPTALSGFAKLIPTLHT